MLVLKHLFSFWDDTDKNGGRRKDTNAAKALTTNATYRQNIDVGLDWEVRRWGWETAGYLTCQRSRMCRTALIASTVLVTI
jgi:hypothetical protein